jgi:hypothetical protein
MFPQAFGVGTGTNSLGLTMPRLKGDQFAFTYLDGSFYCIGLGSQRFEGGRVIVTTAPANVVYSSVTVPNSPAGLLLVLGLLNPSSLKVI